MTIGRIIAITAVLCAAIGMTTQAEAAKRKATGSIKLRGCAYLQPFCGTVMGSGPDTYVLSGVQVPLYTPILVRGQKTGHINLCWGYGTQVRVDRYAPDADGRCTYRWILCPKRLTGAEIRN
jgi:hypothetical protein